MKQRTPGPWKVVPSWHDYTVEGPNGEEIIWQDGNYNTPTISKEDANLMAASPAMQGVLCDLQGVLARFNNREDGAEDDLLYYYTKIIPKVLALSEGKEVT